MKSKLFLLSLVLILAMFLAGCGVLITDETNIEDIIEEYCQAINDQDWYKAKSCCIYGEGEYNAIAYIEDALDDYNEYHVEYINIYIENYDVHIYGNYSEVYSYVTLVVSYYGNVESDSYLFWQYLQKIDSSWKIDKGFFYWYMSED